MSKIIIPILIIFIIGYGLYKKINIYDEFLKGAKEGLEITFNITGTIVAMMFAVNIFLDSGLIEKIVYTFCNNENLVSILPMALLRPISGNASLSIMNKIFIKYGPDSYLGLLSSVIQGCTDTTIYVIALYFGSIHINKSRYAVIVGLFADLVGIISSIIIVKIMFGY